MTAAQKLIHTLLLCIIIAAILNGASFWLKKVGWLDSEQLTSLKNDKLQLNQSVSEFIDSNPDWTLETISPLSELYSQQKQQLLAFLYATPGKLILLKLVKYAMLAMLLISCVVINRKNLGKNLADHKIATLFIFLLLLTTLVNFNTYSWQTILSGMYVFSFLFIIIAASSLINHNSMSVFTRYLSAAMLLLVMMISIELNLSVQLFQNNSIFGKRVTGYMNQPNTLGIFIICVSGFILTHLRDCCNHLLIGFFLVIISVLVTASGSSTAIMLLPILYYTAFANRIESVISIVNLKTIISAIVVVALLIVLVGRFNIDSLLGRFTKLQYYFSSDLSILQILIGNGIGMGTNTLSQLLSVFPNPQTTALGYNYSSDSTVLVLLIQVGVLGCGLFYFYLFKAFTNPHSIYKPVYLLIFFCSFTINIIEVFPINILLGLMLALEYPKPGSGTHSGPRQQ